MLVLFVNGKQDTEDTVSIHIQQLKEKYPDLNIFAINHRWTQTGTFSMGMIRAIPTSIIKQIWETNKIETNPIIVSNDADCFDLPKNYLEKYDNKIGEDEFGSGGAIFERDSGNLKYDLNVVFYRISQLVKNSNIRNIKKSLPYTATVASGANTAFRLSQYTGENMYDLSKDGGEDIGFSRKLKTRYKSKIIRGNAVLSDDRRIKNSFNSGKFLHQSWKDWEGDGSNGRENEEIKKETHTPEQLIEYTNQYLAKGCNYMVRQNYHEGSSKVFCEQINMYVEQFTKYLKIALQSGHAKNMGIKEIPRFRLNKFESNAISNDELIKDLENHKFIESSLHQKNNLQ